MAELGLNRKHGRSSFEIIYIILDYCRTPKASSVVAQKAKCRNSRWHPYRNLLLRLQLLVIRLMDDTGRMMFQTTAKGLQYLEHFHNSMELLEVKI